MRHLKKHIAGLNKVLQMNYEVEEMYHDALENVMDDDLKTFFRNIGFERNEYSRVLRGEISKLGGEPTSYEGLGRIHKWMLMKLKDAIKSEDHTALMDYVCTIEQFTIGTYNAVLQERNVPLSICKMLIEQRDNIESTINTIQAQEALVA